MRKGVDERWMLRVFGERLLGSQMQRARARQNISKLVHDMDLDILTNRWEAQ
jgi:hypothetical protein